MKERRPQDIAWNEQRLRNAEHNRLLADNIVWHGQFWRRTTTAKVALKAVTRRFIEAQVGRGENGRV